MKKNETFVIKEVKLTQNKPLKTHKIDLTRKLVLTALFAAIITVSDAYLAFRIPNLGEYNFNLVISFFAGALLGGPFGFLAGILGDFFGWLLFVDGMFNPILSVASGFVCFLPGFLYSLNAKIKAKGRKAVNGMIILAVCFIFVFFVITVLVKSYGMWIFFSPKGHAKYGTFIAYAVVRMGTQWPNTLANLILSIVLYIPLKKIKYYKGIL